MVPQKFSIIRKKLVNRKFRILPEALITFCFTDELPDNFDLVGKLLVISDRLFINSLRLKCDNYLARHLNEEKCAKNALKLFSFSLQTTAQVLASKCMHIINRDLTVLLETGYLGKLKTL